jgi:hypothetical protein
MMSEEEKEELPLSEGLQKRAIKKCMVSVARGSSDLTNSSSDREKRQLYKYFMDRSKFYPALLLKCHLLLNSLTCSQTRVWKKMIDLLRL